MTNIQASLSFSPLSNHTKDTYCPAQLNYDNCIKYFIQLKKKKGVWYMKNQHINQTFF